MLFNDGTTPSENISVWMPRVFILCRLDKTASGIATDPHLKGRPVFDQLCQYLPMVLAVHLTFPGKLTSGNGSSISTTASIFWYVWCIQECPLHVVYDLCDHMSCIQYRARVMSTERPVNKIVFIRGDTGSVHIQGKNSFWK